MNHTFNVDIAIKLGVEKAVIIENMAFWIKKNIANGTHDHEGRTWTYNSARAFAEMFPYMSKSKIARLLREMEGAIILVSGNYSPAAYDKTKWYSIKDEEILSMYGISYTPQTVIVQKRTIEGTNLNNRMHGIEQPITDITAVVTTGKKEPSPAKPEDTKKASRERIIKYLNAKLSTGYKPNAAKSATPINARLSEGFTDEDFKTVIDDRVSIWLNDSEMQKFLRPETLFGPKFEGYLQNTKIQTTPASKQPLDLNRDRTDEY